ncbi:MAG: type I methionyl aminopeptidase [Calditrichaeota bacterium]|nr:MAG: type I methionyl aminopeptidase [Calditrichota bacterium]
MIHLRSPEEIEKIRKSARLVSKTLGEIAARIEPGVTTLELDRLAETYIRDHGAAPAFKGYNGFPYTLCMSRNEEIVHGFPSNKPLREGDIISVDCGVKWDGYHGDHAYTFVVGHVPLPVLKLLQVTKACLDAGIREMRTGNKIGDVSHRIQEMAEAHGYGVVRELVGHGVGRDLHEEPQVPNYGRPGKGPRIQNGMVLAIEPMINMGTARVLQLDDGWTVITADRQPSAHFEHDVAVVNGQPEVLSTFEYVEEALRKKGAVII